MVQVNKREAGWNLYARSGTIDQATVAWNVRDHGASNISRYRPTMAKPRMWAMAWAIIADSNP